MATKVVVGVILALVFCAVMWLAPAWVLALLLLAVSVFGSMEMMNLLGRHSSAVWAALFSSVVPLAVWFLGVFGIGAGIAAALSLIGIRAVFTRANADTIVDEIKATIAAVVCCGFLSALWIPIAKVSRTGNINWIFWMMGGVYSNDIGAYFGGKLFGRRRLSKLSPNKTVEGLIAGSLVSTVFFSILGWQTPLGTGLGLALGLMVSVLAPVGDLFESALKRAAGKKDSGALFPGHGGILDRTDSVLFCAPAALLVYYVGLVF